MALQAQLASKQRWFYSACVVLTLLDFFLTTDCTITMLCLLHPLCLLPARAAETEPVRVV
jgi:hypothetical protein